jgi:hypothetical protein
MMVDGARQRLRFREEIWKLIAKKTRRGPAEILRAEVEVIGASLGLTEEDACLEFLGLRFHRPRAKTRPVTGLRSPTYTCCNPEV